MKVLTDGREIVRLTQERLQKVASREEGWTLLYIDPTTGTYWELTYPHSERHGGGPPQLAEVDADEVRRCYGIGRS